MFTYPPTETLGSAPATYYPLVVLCTADPPNLIEFDKQLHCLFREFVKTAFLSMRTANMMRCAVPKNVKIEVDTNSVDPQIKIGKK